MCMGCAMCASVWDPEGVLMDLGLCSWCVVVLSVYVCGQ